MKAGTIRDELRQHGYSTDTVDRFMAYHSQNPEVWRAFEATANQMLAEGLTHIGAKMIAEKIRYFDSTIVPGIRINNSFTALYARVFCCKYPQHRERFNLRIVTDLKPLPISALEKQILASPVTTNRAVVLNSEPAAILSGRAPQAGQGVLFGGV